MDIAIRPRPRVRQEFIRFHGVIMAQWFTCTLDGIEGHGNSMQQAYMDWRQRYRRHARV